MGLTGTGTLSKDFSYNVKLFLHRRALRRVRARSRALFTLEKLDISTQEYKTVEESEDLYWYIIDTEKLRVVIEDNTGDGDPGGSGGPSGRTRGDYYIRNGLHNFLNILVPLRIEVRKYEGSSKTDSPIGRNEVRAVFEVIDQREDTANIKGPRHHVSTPRTGKGCVEALIQSTRKGENDDNCIRDFATPGFPGTCRMYDRTVNARDVLFRMRGGRLRPLRRDPSNTKRAMIRIREHATGRKEGTANVFFHPPPILGDNYKLKITINNMHGNPMPLQVANKDPDTGDYRAEGLEPLGGSFDTPTITVWKRVKIHMVVMQVGVSYGIMRPGFPPWAGGWDEVKNAYRDAFIDIEEPPPERRFQLSLADWMEYLSRFVYGPGARPVNWRNPEWTTYRASANAAAHNADFAKYCFPQNHLVAQPGTPTKPAIPAIPGSDRLLPPDDAPSGGVNAWDVLGRLTRRVVFDRLSTRPPGNCMNICTLARRQARGCSPARRQRCRRERRREWRRFRNPSERRRIGMCVLICHSPSASSTVGGQHQGGKLFFMKTAGQNFARANNFVHELGHALFLDHGSTDYARATVNPPPAVAVGPPAPPQPDTWYVFRSEKSGEEGPFFDDHYSEDMISCTMSYKIYYYYNDGSDLPNPGPGVRPSRVDWHFCGGCLLRLRFLNVRRMIRRGGVNDSFRRLNYGRRPEIAFIETASLAGSPAAPAKPVEHIIFARARPAPQLTIPRGDTKHLLVLYPREGVVNTLGLDQYKDICFLSQSRIVFRRGGRRVVRRRGEWISSDPTRATVRVIEINNRWFSELTALRTGNTAITFVIRYGPNAGDVVTSDTLNVRVR